MGLDEEASKIRDSAASRAAWAAEIEARNTAERMRALANAKMLLAEFFDLAESRQLPVRRVWDKLADYDPKPRDWPTPWHAYGSASYWRDSGDGWSESHQVTLLPGRRLVHFGVGLGLARERTKFGRIRDHHDVWIRVGRSRLGDIAAVGLDSWAPGAADDALLERSLAHLLATLC